MTDEKYVFMETVKERKNISHAAHHLTSKKLRKGCKLPSDYLSAKERKNMDSAVVSVKKGVPITANEFRWLSEDGKREYLSGMAGCGFGEKQIAEKPGIRAEIIHRLVEQYHITIETISEDLHPISYSEFKNLSPEDQGVLAEWCSRPLSSHGHHACGNVECFRMDNPQCTCQTRNPG